MGETLASVRSGAFFCIIAIHIITASLLQCEGRGNLLIDKVTSRKTRGMKMLVNVVLMIYIRSYRISSLRIVNKAFILRG